MHGKKVGELLKTLRRHHTEKSRTHRNECQGLRDIQRNARSRQEKVEHAVSSESPTAASHGASVCVWFSLPFVLKLITYGQSCEKNMFFVTYLRFTSS
jgi:hypothetical protein